MKERPILFKGEMVRAILSGQKTQTRRVMKPQPELQSAFVGGVMRKTWVYKGTADTEGWLMHKMCPYGQPGDRLWVREAWTVVLHDPGYDNGITEGGSEDFAEGIATVKYLADDSMKTFDFLDDVDDAQAKRAFMKSKPSIHMPRWACRIVLEVVSVRVERLQGISLIDAEAEGLVKRRSDVYRGDIDYLPFQDGEPFRTPVEAYRALWESINGHESWSANPWVWVVEFRKVTE